MVLVLKLSLSALRARANRFGIIPVKSSTRLSMEQLRAILIIARNQKRHTERSAHDALLTVRTLTEAQGEITDRLSAALDAEGFVVVE